jgi:hypothetical protein
MAMIYVGVDVGIKGGIAILNEDGKKLAIFKMPVKPFKFGEKGKTTSLVDIATLKSTLLPLIGMYKKESVLIGIERLFMGKGSRGNGVLISGMNYGRLWAVLEIITPNIKIISAQTWQSKLFKLHKIEPSDDSKTMSIELASKLHGRINLIPSGGRVPSDGYADALNIAECLRVFENKGKE